MATRRVAHDFTKRQLTATAADVACELREIEAEYRERVAGIRAHAGKPTFETTFKKLAEADGIASYRSVTCVLPSLVSGCPESRKASSGAKGSLGKMWLEAYACPVLYQKLKDAQTADGNAGRDEQDLRLVELVLQKFEASGAGIADDSTRKAYVCKAARIRELAGSMEQNINEDTTAALFSREELRGLPDSFIDALTQKVGEGGEKLFEASVKAPVRMPIMKQADLAETRKKMQYVAGTACAVENGPILNELLETRRTAAKLLGFETHADFALSTKTARTTKAAMDFCIDISDRMKAKLAAETDELRRENGGQPVESWDVGYLCSRLRKKDGVDEEALKEFFPLEPTLHKIFAIYEDLLGLKVTREASLPTWHEEVMRFAVADAATGELAGWLYMDLFPREGKFGHQMIFPLAPCFDGCSPACCYMGNLARAESADQGVLMRATEVRTMFHELGHAMHCLCTRTKYSMLSWAWPMVPWPGGVEQDFLEVPSTMFEQWMLEPEVLTKVSSPKKDGSTIPTETLAALKADAKRLKVSESLATYYAMSVADLNMHTCRENTIDARRIYADALTKIRGLSPQEGTHPAASWYHVAIGYDAGYYGYGWAECYAQDLFESFRRNGLFDEATGRRLREAVLEPCAAKPAARMLTDFLQREPTKQAYLTALGIQA
ncbi:Thimet-like oligopeptidase [Diplonema papillatum]|nr:Thimet-like oligopeptidase [Diplonema papillatum]